MEVRWARSVGAVVMLVVGLLLALPLLRGASVGRDGSGAISGAAILEELTAVVAPQVTLIQESSFGQETPTDPQASSRQGPAVEVSDPSRAFVADLRAANLDLGFRGDRIVTSTVGSGNARQLVLSQVAVDRFGITKNPFFDPLRAAVIRDGEAVVDLATGVILGHEIGSAMFGATEVIEAELLEQLRSNAGWTISAARRAEAARYERILGYVPVFLQSDEAYATYKDAARANYETLAAAA